MPVIISATLAPPAASGRMYRSGITSALLRRVDEGGGERTILPKATKSASDRSADAKGQVPWRTLALALADDDSSSGATAAQTSRSSAAAQSPRASPARGRRRFKKWLEREGIAIAGDGDCKTMAFHSEYYSTLARVLELQAGTLALTSPQVTTGIQLVWASAPAASRCLFAALQLELACARHWHAISREKCVELVACSLKWAQFVREADPRAPASQLRRAIIAVSDSVFRGLQPAAWQIAQPLHALRGARLIEVAPASPRGKLSATAINCGVDGGDAFDTEESRELEGKGTYVFHEELLVKKKLSVDCVPSWLEDCSDEHLLDAACSCPTYFEVCNQFAKQEQQDRERCQQTISEIHKLEQKVAVLCREDDAAVRYAYTIDWEKSNLFRDNNRMKEELERREAEFDASMDDMIKRQNARLKLIQEAKQRYQRLRSQQEHSASFTPEELTIVRGNFFRCVMSTCAALSSALPMLGEVIHNVADMLKERPDFHVEEFLSHFVHDRPETVMELPPREFLRRWAAWLAGKAGWKGDHMNLRIPEDLKSGDLYMWLHAAIKVLSSNDLLTPYLPKGESLKIGSSLVFVGERIMRDWAMKKAVFLAARIAAGDLDAAESHAHAIDSDTSSCTDNSSSWSSSNSGSGDDNDGDSSDDITDGGADEVQNSDQKSRKSGERKSDSGRILVTDNEDLESSSEDGSQDSDSCDSSSCTGDDDEYSNVGSTRSGSSSRGKVEISIGTRIKQQNQVRHVLGDEDALAADLAEMEEESRLNMIRERKEAIRKKLLEAKKKKKDKKRKGKKDKKDKKGKKDKKDKKGKTNEKSNVKLESKVSFKEGEKSSNVVISNGKKKSKRRKRKMRLKVNVNETDEQKELRRLLMVRDAIIKSNKPLREGPDRIYKSIKMAATAILTGIRSYRATMGFFFKFKPPKELEEAATSKERMATVVELFRQYLPSGFLVDFDLDCGAPEPHYALLGALFVCHPCMHAKSDPKQERRMRNKHLMNSSMPPKERLYFAQVTLSGLQLVLQELVSAQPPHLVVGASDEYIDSQIKSWLHRCSSAWSQISTIARDLAVISQQERQRLSLWERLQAKIQRMRAEFNMQRTRVAMLEVKRQKNAEKEQAAAQKKIELAEALAFQREAAKCKEGRRALAKLSHVTVARFEDIFSESYEVDFDDIDDNDDEESKEQKKLDKAKKIKNRMIEKQVEMNLCLNILLQRFVTIERIFAYYCRCIKVIPTQFRFRQSIGPKEFAVFCQECELTGDVKGRLTVIEARRIFKTANMEGEDGDVSGDTDLEIEEFFELLIRLGWAVYGARGVAANSILPKRLTLSEALVELLDHHSVLRLALQEDRLIFLNLVEDSEVQSVLEEHEQDLLKVWKSYQDRRKAAEGEELKGLSAVQWARLLEESGAFVNNLTEEVCTSIFEMVQDTGEDDEGTEAGSADEEEEQEDSATVADNARMDFEEFKVGLCAAAMCKYADPHEHLADKVDHLIKFNLLRG